MATVTLQNIKKSFGATDVIHGIDVSIQDGEFIVIVGPSGCGKSTLLRMVAGLETATSGDIFIGDERANDKEPMDRDIAMVFQNYALYPHMTVAENMGFGLKMNGVAKNVVKEKVLTAAKILKLEDYLDRRPKALSGGQRQRVAIGRAIVRGPEVFLFDEPLSNLDAALRVQTRIEIARLHESLGTTMIYVTHDQVEAMTLADKIVVLRDGKIEQIGSPIELYKNPNNMFVAQFIGSPKMNFFELKDLTDNGRSLIRSGANTLGIRPEHLKISTAGAAVVEGIPNLIEHLGEYALVHCETSSGNQFIVKTTDLDKISKGTLSGFNVDVDDTYSFDSAS